MGQTLHGSAKTTHVVRAAIQRSKALIRHSEGTRRGPAMLNDSEYERKVSIRRSAPGKAPPSPTPNRKRSTMNEVAPGAKHGLRNADENAVPDHLKCLFARRTS